MFWCSNGKEKVFLWDAHTMKGVDKIVGVGLYRMRTMAELHFETVKTS